MLLNRNFVRKNIVAFSIIVFVLAYVVIISYQPSFLYKEDGSLRTFGIGYRHKTVVPMWLVVIAIAIFSYMIIHYYLIYHRLKL
jgi:hypothetical protein